MLDKHLKLAKVSKFETFRQRPKIKFLKQSTHGGLPDNKQIQKYQKAKMSGIEDIKILVPIYENSFWLDKNLC